MAIIPIKLVKVKANGKRFILLAEEGTKVRVKGEIVRVSGASAVHGPDKVFLKDRVEVLDAEYSEELLGELLGESTMAQPVEKKAEKRKKWLEKDKLSGRKQLTEHAHKQLEAEGYDVGMDGLGNYLDEGMLQDAAMDSAMYHYELTAEGAPEGLTSLREGAADYIYEGMLRALKEKKAAGEKVTMDGRY